MLLSDYEVVSCVVGSHLLLDTDINWLKATYEPLKTKDQLANLCNKANQRDADVRKKFTENKRLKVFKFLQVPC